MRSNGPLAYVVIGTIMTTLILGVAILNSCYVVVAIWIGCSLMSLVLGYLAVKLIRPRYPGWWKDNIG